ncbi:hypothetical protein B0H14DRAFT_3146837 [Mycena olivaceomarginata]|nr:hypothetical protein B0H14DRAFT_3146837 [Mycena olivaceomarginata]
MSADQYLRMIISTHHNRGLDGMVLARGSHLRTRCPSTFLTTGNIHTALKPMYVAEVVGELPQYMCRDVPQYACGAGACQCCGLEGLELSGERWCTYIEAGVVVVEVKERWGQYLAMVRLYAPGQLGPATGVIYCTASLATDNVHETSQSPLSRSVKLTFDYVLIPPAVKRDLAKRCSQCTPEPMVVDEPQIEEIAMLEEGEKEEEPEPECEPEIDLMELRAREVRGTLSRNAELADLTATINIDKEEQVAMLEACTRMREVPCRWFACTSVLNSLENVVTHLHEVHAQEDMDLMVLGAKNMCSDCNLYVGCVWRELRDLDCRTRRIVLPTNTCSPVDCREYPKQWISTLDRKILSRLKSIPLRKR